MRLYELARELGIPTKSLLEKAKKSGLSVKNVLGSVTEQEAQMLRNQAGGRPEPEKQPEAGEKPTQARAQSTPVESPGKKAEEQKRPEKPKKAKKKPSQPAQKQAEEDDETPKGRGGKKKRGGKKGSGKPKPASRDNDDDSDDTKKPADSPQTAAQAAAQSRRPVPVQSRYDRKRPFRRSRGKSRSYQRQQKNAQPQLPREVDIETPVTVKDLSAATGLRANEIIALLMKHNIMVNINALLDAEAVMMIAEEKNLTININESKSAEEELEDELKQESEERPEDLKPVAPVVTFMGHVDHGKTLLLDRIRHTKVAEGETGGITQHIGASRIEIEGKAITFLDTPGHEAFTAMRARGANATDIVVLVVAAEEGIMPQTEEAIDHALAAEVPMIVAINKIDKPEADPERVRRQLAEKSLVPEEWGGETVCVEVSAMTGQGIDDLLEMLLIVAELQELKANPNKRAVGTALEARLDRSRGMAATLLIQEGTLRKGDVALSGTSFGKVKAIQDDKGKNLKEAGPSMPVEVYGLNEAPEAGDRFVVVESLQKAREIAATRREQQREREMYRPAHVSLENLMTAIEEGNIQELMLIVKADVKGTIEALQNVFDKLPTEKVKLRVLRKGVGTVTESDILLADASDAIVIGLHVGIDGKARQMAERTGVQVRLYDIIYRVEEEIHKALEGMLAPEEVEKVVGHAEVRQIFKISRIGTVAGCYVTDGVFPRTAKIRLIRDQRVIWTGQLDSLKRVKDDVREVREGFECGIKLAGYDDIKEGDVLEAFVIEKVAQTL